MSNNCEEISEVIRLIELGELRVVQSRLDESSIVASGVGRLTVDFFLRYEYLSDSSGGLVVDARFLFEPFKIDGYIKFGAQDGSPFLIKSGSDICYILSGGEIVPEDGDKYENIWHFLASEGSS